MSIKKVHFIGKTLIELPSCPSTNEYALSLLSKSKPNEGTVILTFNQTQGRGQIGSKWVSEAFKNVAFSCILHPHFLAPKEQIALNQAVALAVLNLMVRYTQKEVHVKWPNDIYVDNRKIAGILIQNILSSNKFNTSIVGIGINVNQQEFPNDLPTATSLSMETGHIFNLKELSLELCDLLNQQYNRLMNQPLNLIHEEYLKHLYRFRQWNTFETSNGIAFKGRIIGVSSAGKLQVEKEGNDGFVEEFGIKEIRLK